MIHFALMTAVLVDQAAQGPLVVQIPQLESDPWFKWLLPTIVQTIVSLLSIGSGVAIAVRSFRANRRSEHEQWIRDQKKAEWKELFSIISRIEQEIPVIYSGIPSHENLEATVLGILPLLRGQIFIYPVLESGGSIKEWEEYVLYVSGRFTRMTQTYPLY